jgi:hypothetical protein
MHELQNANLHLNNEIIMAGGSGNMLLWKKGVEIILAPTYFQQNNVYSFSLPL